MTTLEALRKANKDAINQNPVSITVTRKTSADSSTTGGLAITPTTVGPYTVRIYSRAREPQIVSSQAGTKNEDPGWGMLTDHLFEPKASSRIEDSFTVTGLGDFVIKHVFPWRLMGSIVGYQASLEKVS